MNHSKASLGLSLPYRDRLKPVRENPLEAVGLPSKGDKTLVSFHAQEAYYAHILDGYRHLGKAASQIPSRASEHVGRPVARSWPKMEHDALEVIRSRPDKHLQDPPLLSGALRKLREGIFASQRVDDFALNAYIFNIRVAILLDNMQSYYPALLQLLKVMHDTSPISEQIRQEIQCWHVLDLASRQEDLLNAHRVYRSYSVDNISISSAIRALIYGHWSNFWTSIQAMDEYQQCLVKPAKERMRQHALACINKSYLTIDLLYVEKATNCQWAALTKSESIKGWQVDNGAAIIKQIRRK